MILAIIVLLIVLSMLYMFLPLFPLRILAETADSNSNSGDTYEISDLLLHKETLLAAIKEIDFDYKTGKLSDEDYQELQEVYRSKAMSVIEEIEESEKKQGEAMEKKLEEEIKASRQKGDNIQPPKQTKATLNCPSCSNPYVAGDKFCQRCGYAFKSLCQNCGQSLAKTDKYCPDCGKSVGTLIG